MLQKCNDDDDGAVYWLLALPPDKNSLFPIKTARGGEKEGSSRFLPMTQGGVRIKE